MDAWPRALCIHWGTQQGPGLPVPALGQAARSLPVVIWPPSVQVLGELGCRDGDAQGAVLLAQGSSWNLNVPRLPGPPLLLHLLHRALTSVMW